MRTLKVMASISTAISCTNQTAIQNKQKRITIYKHSNKETAVILSIVIKVNHRGLILHSVMAFNCMYILLLLPLLSDVIVPEADDSLNIYALSVGRGKATVIQRPN